MILQPQAVIELPGVPGHDVHHQVDADGVLDGTGTVEVCHIDDADSPQLDVIADQRRGTADEGAGADPLDLHGIIGDEPVATLDELHGSFALADAAFADEQHTLAVDLHEHAVAGDPGGQGTGQIGDDGRNDGAGGGGGAQNGDVVLFCHFQTFGTGDQVTGGDEGRDLEAEEPVIDVEPLGGAHLVEIA